MSLTASACGFVLFLLSVSGNHPRSYGSFRGRVRPRHASPADTQYLVINELQLNDSARYRYEVFGRLVDESVMVALELRGVVFPYSSQKGQNHFNFLGAQEACEQQDAALATVEQLLTAWEDGLDWCKAGWLANGTVMYPITDPRENCGGANSTPGFYEPVDRINSQYDAFCFAAPVKGTVYFFKREARLNFTEAVQACASDGSQIARVGQLYAAWRMRAFDSCYAGWLADGSVRYPITKARDYCGPAGVRSFGYRPAHQEFSVYCHR